MTGFLYLDKRRGFISAGMTVLPQYITMEAIEAYCRLMGWKWQRQRDFMYYVEVLDDEQVMMKRARIAGYSAPDQIDSESIH